MSDQPTNQRGASFAGVDFTGATFRDGDFRHVTRWPIDDVCARPGRAAEECVDDDGLDRS